MTTTAAPTGRPNKYAGPCDLCGADVPAGAGMLCGSRRTGWTARHHEDAHPVEFLAEPIEPEAGPTTRERREARADRLREWAEKREAKAEAEHATARARAEVIPFGQPILVGHYSERRDRNYRAKISAGFERSFEHAKKAESMASRADGIEHQLATSIYDDDPDACERLAEKLARLEAKRDQMKARNKEARAKGEPAPFTGWPLSNLGATIRTTRQRLDRLNKEQQQ